LLTATGLTYALAVYTGRILHTGLDCGPRITFNKTPDPKIVKSRWTTFADTEGNEFDLFAG
jgi:hypothetical protein